MRSQLLSHKTTSLNTHRRKNFPPFGKALAERRLMGEVPFLTYVLAFGHPNYPHQIPRDPWDRAKAILSVPHKTPRAALILPSGEPPAGYVWPVRDSICILEHWPSRGMDHIVSALADCLKRAGAEFVVVRDARFNCTRRVL